MTGTTVQDQTVKQDVFDVSVAGSPFELWAGPVSLAFGGGYRSESSVQVVDPLSSSLRNFTGGYLGCPLRCRGSSVAGSAPIPSRSTANTI